MSASCRKKPNWEKKEGKKRNLKKTMRYSLREEDKPRGGGGDSAVRSGESARLLDSADPSTDALRKAVAAPPGSGAAVDHFTDNLLQCA